MKKLSIMAVISLVFLFACGTSDADTTNDEASNSSTELVEASFNVSGNCGMCKDRIEKTAKDVEGVETALWDKESKILKITHKKGVNIHLVHQQIANAGHDTEMLKAKDEVYNNLPNCCKYRSGNEHEGDSH